MTARKAVVKYRRAGANLGPPHGFGDLPGAVETGLVLRAGWYPTALGRRTVEEGELLVFSGAFVVRRALTWQDGHPRDEAVQNALREPGLGPWEIGWAVAVADWS